MYVDLLSLFALSQIKGADENSLQDTSSFDNLPICVLNDGAKDIDVFVKSDDYLKDCDIKIWLYCSDATDIFE